MAGEIDAGNSVQATKPKLTPEELRAKRIATLQKYKFKPGISGNPSGRGKLGGLLMQELKRALRERPEGDPQRRTMARLIATAMTRKAVKGDVDAAKFIADRVFGKVREPDDADRPQTIIVQVARNVPRAFASEPKDEESDGSVSAAAAGK